MGNGFSHEPNGETKQWPLEIINYGLISNYSYNLLLVISRSVSCWSLVSGYDSELQIKIHDERDSSSSPPEGKLHKVTSSLPPSD